LAHAKEYDRNDWVGLLVDIFKTSADTRQMEILIRLDFFKEFGSKEVLLEIYLAMADKKKANTELYPDFADKEIVETKINKKTGETTYKPKTIKRPLKFTSDLKEKTQLIRLENLRAYEEAVRANPPAKIELYEQIAFEKDNLGYAVSTWHNVNSALVLVIEINKKYTPKVTLYQIKTGKEIVVKVSKKKFFSEYDDLLYVGDIIKVLDTQEKNGWRNVDGKWVEDTSKQELWLETAEMIRKSNKRSA